MSFCLCLYYFHCSGQCTWETSFHSNLVLMQTVKKNGKLCECYSLRLLFTLWVSFSVCAYICMSSISLSLCLCPSRPGLLKAGDPGLPWLADSWPSTSLPANSGLGAPKDLTNFGRGGKLSRGYNTAKEKAWKRRSQLQRPQEREWRSQVQGPKHTITIYIFFLNSCMRIMNISASIDLSVVEMTSDHTHTTKNSLSTQLSFMCLIQFIHVCLKTIGLIKNVLKKSIL